nr:UDP-glucuronosyltransferase 1A8-like [Lytechinus pictus]
MKICVSLTVTIFIIDVVSIVKGANIVVSLLVPVPSSHARGLSDIAGALTRRGHNVTIITSSSEGTNGFSDDTYSRSIQYKFAYPQGLPPKEELEKEFLDLAFESSRTKQIKVLRWVFTVIRHGCKCLFDDSRTLALLKESNFDILIGDAFDSCDVLLSSYLGLPYIAVTTAERYPLFNERVYGIPMPPSYVPFGNFPLPDRMSFGERILSFIEHHVFINIIGWTHFRALDTVKIKHNIAPGKSIPDLLGRAELWLCMTNFAFDFPHPTAPNWVAVGNTGDTPAEPLEKDFEIFVQGSGEHGFIVFSLGTHFTELPNPEMTEAFARVFSELPQRVIWRYTGPRPRNLGNNTMLVEWMPQNDLVGHPKARLLVYHGGAKGILEAIYHAVPMVIMPIFAEQESNAVKVVVRGIGIRLQKDAISYETVNTVATEVLSNPSYKENVQRISRIYRDTQSNPDDVVIYWVEHILKFGGSHLRTRALELNFIQLHSIDVLAFIVGILLVIAFLLVSCFKRCIACCFNREKIKVE